MPGIGGIGGGGGAGCGGGGADGALVSQCFVTPVFGSPKTALVHGVPLVSVFVTYLPRAP